MRFKSHTGVGVVDELFARQDLPALGVCRYGPLIFAAKPPARRIAIVIG